MTNQFAIHLFQYLVAQQPASNLVCAPLNIAPALAVAAEGAVGATQHELLAALGASDPAALATALHAAYADLTARGEASFQYAAALFVDARLAGDAALNDEFVARAAAQYGATLATHDFADAATVRVINAWVAAQTHNKIDSIISELRPDDVLLILTAMYLRASWNDPFPAHDTHDAAFTRADGETMLVPMMRLTETLRYTEAAGTQVVALALRGVPIDMLVMLPLHGSSHAELLAAMDAEQFAAIHHTLRPTPVTLALPRFRIASEIALVPVLQSLGITQAFGAHADFGAMGGPAEGLYISDVRHRTYLDVGEDGVEDRKSVV